MHITTNCTSEAGEKPCFLVNIVVIIGMTNDLLVLSGQLAFELPCGFYMFTTFHLLAVSVWSGLLSVSSVHELHVWCPIEQRWITVIIIIMTTTTMETKPKVSRLRRKIIQAYFFSRVQTKSKDKVWKHFLPIKQKIQLVLLLKFPLTKFQAFWGAKGANRHLSIYTTIHPDPNIIYFWKTISLIYISFIFL